MKITVKGGPHGGYGFYDGTNPLFFSKWGDDPIALIEQVLSVGATDIDYAGEMTEAECEKDFA